MSDSYQSTDRKSTDTRPETPRLLLESTATLATTDFSAVTGGYFASVEIEITDLNDLGNRVKGFGPQTLQAEIMHTLKLTPGGQIDDYFYPLPYSLFSNYSTGAVSRSTWFEIHNAYVIAGSSWASYLTIYFFQDAAVTRDISFSYKIYSTVFEFDDVA